MPPSIETTVDLEQIVADAEKELGAFLAAVHQVLGTEKVRRAADLWLTTLERMEWTGEQTNTFFGRVTIQTAKILAHIPPEPRLRPDK